MSGRHSLYLACCWLLLVLGLAGCAHQAGERLPDQELRYLGRDPEQPQNSLYQVRDLTFTVFPGVFQPAPDSLALLRHTRIHPGESVLDMGTGAGVQAIFAARTARHVVATDINPAAARNTRHNARRLGVADKISVRQGDLFAPIGPRERFDVILFNIEYPNSDADLALWQVHERFFAQVRQHLRPGGRIYYQFGLQRNMARLRDMLARHGLRITAQFQDPAVVPGEQYITCEIRPAPPGRR